MQEGGRSIEFLLGLCGAGNLKVDFAEGVVAVRLARRFDREGQTQEDDQSP
jgi:hypothetical protein